MTTEEADIISLYGVPGVGTKTFARLAAVFGSPGAVFAASERDLLAVPDIGPVTAKSILTFDRERFTGEQERRMKMSGARLLIRSSSEYPRLLNMFPSAPPVIFVRGDIACLGASPLAFVGTRKPTPYGLRMTRTLAAGAVRSGSCIVSGMAAGIDTEAHRTALDEGGATVAVFGCGVDIIYPTSNHNLARAIEKTGCLVSHFPMGRPGEPGNFPARNSCIVGLSLGTVVVEAPKKSGALITADLTLRAGRKLFTVPGPADSPLSEGTNGLLDKGAHPVTAIAGIMNVLGKPVPEGLSGHTAQTASSPAHAPARPLPGGLAGDILTIIENEPLHIEKLCGMLGKSVSEVLSELTMLEIDGFVRQLPGKLFERNR